MLNNHMVDGSTQCQRSHNVPGGLTVQVTKILVATAIPQAWMLLMVLSGCD